MMIDPAPWKVHMSAGERRFFAAYWRILDALAWVRRRIRP
jgi:hypothetical protein